MTRHSLPSEPASEMIGVHLRALSRKLQRCIIVSITALFGRFSAVQYLFRCNMGYTGGTACWLCSVMGERHAMVVHRRCLKGRCGCNSLCRGRVKGEGGFGLRRPQVHDGWVSVGRR